MYTSARSLLVGAVALLSTSRLAHCQVQYSINPDSVDRDTTEYWCLQQVTQCPLICLQLPGTTAEPRMNKCDAEVLSYACVCSNGATPNMTEYSQTLPYFVCSEWGSQCVNNCNLDSTCQAECRTKHPCGAQSPTRANSTTVSSMAATATADDVMFSSASSVPEASNGSPSNMLYIGQAYGGIVVVSALVGGLALLL